MNQNSNKFNQGILFPEVEELNLYREFQNEAFQRLGRRGLYHPVLEVKIYGTDAEYTYGQPVSVSYTLVENPSMKLLQKFGWNVEANESKPILCYMSYLDNSDKNVEPSEGGILEISARANAHGNYTLNTQKFQIVDAKTDFEMNLFVCNLAPYREIEKPKEPTPTKEDPANEDAYFRRQNIYKGDKKDEDFTG